MTAITAYKEKSTGRIVPQCKVKEITSVRMVTVHDLCEEISSLQLTNKYDDFVFT